MPGALFLQILNMSFTASVVILLVLLARLLLKKAPKIFSYALWGVVLFRLVCPFSFESILSLLPTNANPISQDIVYAAVPEIDTGITLIDNAVNAVLPPSTPYRSINEMQVWAFIGTVVWIAGIAVLLAYSVVSLILLRWRLRDAVRESDNIYRMSNMDTPFVMGLLRPRIYLPASLTAEEKQYVLLHEQTHIKRFDHAVKLLSFLVLCVHWFNPLVWVAFFVSGKDMEMACDEAVIKQLGSEVKKDYSSSLLALATGRRIIGGSPLAFGENDTKGRVKNVLRYRKPALWVAVAAVLVLIIIGVGLLCNPLKKVYALSSVAYNPETGKLHFTVSDQITSDLTLYLQVSGRTEQDGMGTSLHLFEEESADNSWVAGQSYDATLPADALDFIELYGTVTRNRTGVVISETAITIRKDGSIATHKQDYVDMLSILTLKPTTSEKQGSAYSAAADTVATPNAASTSSESADTPKGVFYLPDMDAEQQKFNRLYVEPILLSGLLYCDWSKDDNTQLRYDPENNRYGNYLMFAFEDIIGQERMQALWNEYDSNFPEKVVEDVLLEWFPFTTEQIRECLSTFYRPEEHIYFYEGGRGGGPVVCAVTDVETKDDGFVTLSYEVLTYYYDEATTPEKEAYLNKLSGVLVLKPTDSGYSYWSVDAGEYIQNG